MKPKRGSKDGASQKIAEWREGGPRRSLAIIDYISFDNPDAALRLMDDIENKVTKLDSRPKLYRAGRVAGTREMVVRPNYLVIYTEAPNGVLVLRILHSAQFWP
jgi:toxin ParE1/3/4